MTHVSARLGQFRTSPTSATSALVRRLRAEGRDIAMQAPGQTPGLRYRTPEGAFHLFVDCSGVIGRTMPGGKVIETDKAFAEGMIEHGGVAVVPGSAFGLSPFFRLSRSVDTGQPRLATERIRRFCDELR